MPENLVFGGRLENGTVIVHHDYNYQLIKSYDGNKFQKAKAVRLAKRDF